MGTAMLGVRALVDGASWSGKEANHLFMNSGSGAFRDLSGISGLDHIADGRVFGILDLDRDGRQDFVLVNTNSPRVLAYRNQVGETDATRFVALRFEGGNDTPGPRPGWSTRDGYGALVKLRAGEVELQREFRCGEGLSAQNSDTLIVGLGEAGSAEQVVIRWPSGREQTLAEVPSGSLVTVFEDPARSPTGEAFVVEPYAAPSASSEPDAGAGTDPGTDAAPRLLAGDHEPAATERPALRVYTTMATWCASCKAKLPALEALRAQFEPSEVVEWVIESDGKQPALSVRRAICLPVRTQRNEYLVFEEPFQLRIFREVQFDQAPTKKNIVGTTKGLRNHGDEVIATLRRVG